MVLLLLLLLQLPPHLRKPVVVVSVVVLVREEGREVYVSKGVLVVERVVEREERFLRLLEHLVGFDELLLPSHSRRPVVHIVRVDSLCTLVSVSECTVGSRSSLEANLQAVVGVVGDVSRSRQYT